jgi:chloride channel protein, CIC family
VSVLTLKRSILTEKIARHGFHVMQEHAVDPLEATFVREVMDTDVYILEPLLTLADVYDALPEGSRQRRQRLYPVLDPEDRLVGVLPWSAVLATKDDPDRTVRDAMIAPAAVAYPDEVLRTIADRMAALGIGVIPVVDRAGGRHLDGLITGFDVLAARQKLLQEERHAERILTLRRVRKPPPDMAGGGVSHAPERA